MALRLYNTLSKKEEDFAPLTAGKVTMYTCGPTVYSRPHIGNYASFLMADLLRRWLEAGHGLHVTHVKNITDVGHLLHDADSGDDKIQKEAEKEKVHPLEIAKRYTEEYLADERTLNFLEPAHRPRATEFIEQMTSMTEQLLKSGHAYVTDDGIYFDVTSKTPTPYGTLSGNTLDAVKAGARVSIKEGKRHPADFALWKFCVGDNAHHVLRWSSPKGPEGESYAEGFPGWHIECSAMSRSLLGDQIDIHTGGEDNIFPHHECEIAQSESVTQKKPFVRYWLHRRRIDLAGEKMSKSLGNVLSIPNILEKGFDAMDIRYYLLSVHYRTNLKFSWKGLEDSRKARVRVVEWMQDVDRLGQEGHVLGQEGKEGQEGYDGKDSVARVRYPRDDFMNAMDSDLNTPGALAAVFDAVAQWNRNAVHTALEISTMQRFADLVRKTFGCFDVVEESIPAEIIALRDERETARAAKDFAGSDRLRKEIEKRGFEVRDVKGEPAKLRKK